MSTYTYRLTPSFGAAKTGQASNVVAKVYDNTNTLQATVNSAWTEQVDSAGNTVTGAYRNTVTINTTWLPCEIRYTITGLAGVWAGEQIGADYVQGNLGDVAGKVLGGGASIIAGVGAYANMIQWGSGPVPAISGNASGIFTPDLLIAYYRPAGTYKFIVFNSNMMPWNSVSGLYEAWSDVDYADYLLTATPLGSSGYYTAVPPINTYRYALVLQNGGVSQDMVVWDDHFPLNELQVPSYVGVNQNTGGVNNLQILSNNVPVSGALVQMYLKSLYDANPQTAPIVGSTMTDVNGDWVEPIYVPSGQTYAVVVSATGNNTLEVGVSV